MTSFSLSPKSSALFLALTLCAGLRPASALAIPGLPQAHPAKFHPTKHLPPSLAQTVAPVAPTDTPNFAIEPRLGISASTSGGSYPSFIRLESFVPLDQDPAEDITFLEGRFTFNLDDDFAETLAGSLLLGHRGYNPDADRIRGGYLALDARGADGQTFWQLGTGYESLGEEWDFRFNAYLPIGDRTQTTRDLLLDTGLQTSTRFQANQLLLETQRQQLQEIRTTSALGGFDAEAGRRITHWDGGDLRGFGGLYFQGAPDVGTYLGWRLRLAADITPNFDAGIALQGDGLFGTRFIVTVAGFFPGVRPDDNPDKREQVPIRLGEPTVRLPEIAVTVDQDTEIIDERTARPLENPEEEQPYRFQHVTLGATGGDGTFENPFGTVQEALNATVQDGNDIVYVNGDTDIPIPAFTIPDRVQVLSQGPRQLIAGLPFPGFENATARLPFSPEINYTDGIVVELPFSGDGNFPQIQNGVTLGNRTILAGFRLENAAGNAIQASNVRNVELRNNTITSPGERGIFLDDVGGSVILFDNSVVGAQGITPDSGQGIFIRNQTTANAIEVTLAGFRADDNRVGIEILGLGDIVSFNSPNQIVTIGPSSAVNTSIGVAPGTVLSNSASNNRESGVLIEADTLAGQEITLRNVTIANNGSAGIVVSDVPSGALTAFQEVQVRDSAIANNATEGIRIIANGTAQQELNFDGNQIINNGAAGIFSTASSSSLQEFVAKPEIDSLGIGNNLISGNNGAGISLNSAGSDTLLVEAQGNQFANNFSGAPDLEIASTNTSRTCFIGRNNTFDKTAALNLRLAKSPGNLFEVGDLPNLSALNDTATLNLTPSASEFTNITRLACL